MSKKTTRKIGNWEIFWIVVTGILGVGGLFMLVLGLVGSFLPVLNDDNWILSSQSTFQAATGLTYIWFGAIVLVLDAIAACIYLNYFAKRSDIDIERAIRRAQRLKIIAESEKVEAEAKKEAEAQAHSELPPAPEAK